MYYFVHRVLCALSANAAALCCVACAMRARATPINQPDNN